MADTGNASSPHEPATPEGLIERTLPDSQIALIRVVEVKIIKRELSPMPDERQPKRLRSLQLGTDEAGDMTVRESGTNTTPVPVYNLIDQTRQFRTDNQDLKRHIAEMKAKLKDASKANEELQRTNDKLEKEKADLKADLVASNKRLSEIEIAMNRILPDIASNEAIQDRDGRKFYQAKEKAIKEWDMKEAEMKTRLG